MIANSDLLFGLGLRAQHYQSIVQLTPSVDWFELITEDFLACGGDDWFWLEKIRANYPLSLHGVSLSIGSVDPINRDYLKQLKQLRDRLEPVWISDHFCWTGVGGINSHDLLPMPHTEEAVKHIVARIIQVQDYLGEPLVLENVSSYVDFSHSEMTEWEFIQAIVMQADCYILLDINNVFVNAFNHGFSANDYLSGIPGERVKQFHIAGHKHCQNHIIDTHDTDITDDVWQLYEQALRMYGPVPLIIERDGEVPPLPVLLDELEEAKQRYHSVMHSLAKKHNKSLSKPQVTR